MYEICVVREHQSSGNSPGASCLSTALPKSDRNMTNPGELENSSELSEQIGQLTQEIRLLRGDLFHYFEVLTRINTGEVTTTTIGSTTISSATSTSSTSLNHENSNVVLLDHDHHNENNVHVVEDDKKDDSDEEDDEEDDSYDPNSGPIMVQYFPDIQFNIH